MPRKSLPNPTDVELEILNVLWERGPSTVRQVHNALAEVRETGYSTTLKMMQVMHEKGLLQRDETVRPQVYRPAKAQDTTQMQMLDRLAQGAFGGAMGSLLMRAISSNRASPEELREIKRLIREAERKQQE